jgi:hypothetical protein
MAIFEVKENILSNGSNLRWRRGVNLKIVVATYTRKTPETDLSVSAVKTVQLKRFYSPIEISNQ